jgi:hypothetical protein
MGGSCPAGTTDVSTDLQIAINAAEATPVADLIAIGPGTFSAPNGGFHANGANPVSIVGSGPSTVLVPGGNGPTITVTGHRLASVAVDPSLTAGDAAVRAIGSSVLSGITVSGTGSAAVGLRLEGPVSVSDSTVTLSGAGLVGISATSDGTSGTPVVEGVVLDAETGFRAFGDPSMDPFTLRRITSVGHGTDVEALGGTVDVSDSVLRHDGGSSIAVSATCSNGASSTVRLRHVTAIAGGQNNGMKAISADCQAAGAAANVTVADSTLRGFASLTNRDAAATATADIAFTYSDVAANPNIDLGPGAVTLGAGTFSAPDAGFASPTDAHLVFGSPLIDAADPNGTVSSGDRDGAGRSVNGRQDIGAYESQTLPWTPPAATETGTTPSSTDGDPVGQPIPVGGPTSGPTGGPVVRSSVSRARLRAELRKAIRTGRRGTHTLRWLVPGRVRFEWRVHGRLVARATASRTTTGRQRVTVKRLHPLPRHGRVAVRATFTRAGAPAIRVSARLSR